MANKNIIIKSKTEKTFANGNRYMVLETVPEGNNQYGEKFTVYEKKIDGTVSNAWKQLQDVRANELVGVLFNEKPREYTVKGITKTTTDRIITNFQPAEDESYQHKATTKQVETKTNQEYQDEKSETITRIAIAKSLIESGAKFHPDTIKEANSWLGWIYQKEVKMALGYYPEPNHPNDIDYDAQAVPVNTDDIPF